MNGNDTRRRRAGALGLVEIMVAMGVITIGFFPMFSLLHQSRDEARDAREFVELMVDASRRELEAPDGDEEVTVIDDPRRLVLKISSRPTIRSFAPERSRP